MTDLNEWDPLQDSPDMAEMLIVSKKRGIKNILKSYTGWFDPLSELIQNALDSVEKRATERDSTYQPIVRIILNIQENSITISDNGIGFTESQLKHFLRPDISFKEGNSRGNKGVGAKYIAYGFNHLEFGTKNGDLVFYGIIKDGRNWVEDSSNIVARPTVKRIEPVPATMDAIDRGAVFTLKLVGDNIRPRNLRWTGAQTVDQWEGILRITTPLGGIYLDGDAPRTKCVLTVIDVNGNKTEKTITKCEYLYPHGIFSQTERLNTIIQKQQELTAKGKDTFKDLPGNLKRLNGIYEIWDSASILNGVSGFNPQLSDAERDLVRGLNPTMYCFFSFTTELWKDFNSRVLGLRSGFEIMRGGLQLATRNMPQGSLITIPLTKSIGYQKTSHVIIHFKDADPDLGRKGFQPEITELAQELSKAAVNRLKNWNALLKRESGAPLNIQASRELHEWVRMQEDHERSHPLSITNRNFFLPMKEIPILSEPMREQDVIVLFNQLLAGGVIRGIKVLGTSQNDQYDSICRIVINKPLENHFYHPTNNPLGINPPTLLSDVVSEPRIMEYKYDLDSLIDDFEKDLKEEKSIKLVVCWKVGEKWKERYAVTPLLHPEYMHYRQFHGATHEVKNLTSGDLVFHLVVLSELIQYLNYPVRSQEYQKNTYLNSDTASASS